MTPQMFATVFFLDIFQRRIMSAGRQYTVHWYTCTQFQMTLLLTSLGY